MGGKIAFLGIPNKREQNQKWSPTKGNKIRSGCLTPTFSGAGAQRIQWIQWSQSIKPLFGRGLARGLYPPPPLN